MYLQRWHGWCHMKLQPSRRKSCVHHTTMLHVTSCKTTYVKPVLNWANVCSPNILRTLRRTMIRFLIKLLVRRIWFGQSILYFILNWLVIRCQTRSRQHDPKCRLKPSQYTFITPHRVIQLTTISFWVSETRLRLPQVNK